MNASRLTDSVSNSEYLRGQVLWDADANRWVAVEYDSAPTVDYIGQAEWDQ